MLPVLATISLLLCSQFEISNALNVNSLPRQPQEDVDTDYPYSETEAIQMLDLAVASWLSDSPDDEAKRQMCYDKSWADYNFTTLFVQDVTCDAEGNSCRMFMAYSAQKNTYALSFRGTVGMSQLVTEFKSTLNRYDDFRQGANGVGKVNHYFYLAANGLWPTIRNHIQANNGDLSANVIVTGHSLGGAMTSITAALLSVNGLVDPKKMRVMTFGQPRTWDRTAAAEYRKWVPIMWRVTHYTDPVPHAPPLGMDGDPYHHTQEIWYNNEASTSFKVCSPTDAEDDACSNGQGTLKFALDTLNNEHMHYMGHLLNKYAQGGCSSALILSTMTSFALIVLRLFVF